MKLRESNPLPVDNELLSNEDPSTMFKDMVRIGHGASGEVFSGEHQVWGKVAIKKINVHTAEQDTSQYLQNELSIMRNTAPHPNIVRYFNTYRKGTHKLWVILEFMDGGSLTDLLPDPAKPSPDDLAEPHLAYITGCILSALMFVHGLHQIHRDIKSDNILLNLDGSVKLADFGFAVQLKSSDATRASIGTS